MKGHCNCGAIAWESDDRNPLGIVVCHCSICRRFTGANGIAIVLVAKSTFRWTRGEDLVREWQKPVGHWEGYFCQTCGSPMPGTNDDDRMFIPAGTIASGAESMEVIHHIWTDSRAAWDVIGDSGQQHDEEFKG